MDIFLNIFAAFGISLGATSYLCLILRTFNAKRLFIESFVLGMIAGIAAFSYFPLEESFRITLGIGGILAAVGLFTARKIIRGFEDRYEKERQERGEKIQSKQQ